MSEPNPYEPSVTPPVANGSRGWAAAVLGFVLGGVLGLTVLFVIGTAFEKRIVPLVVDPSEPFTPYGQLFVLFIGPVAGLLGAVVGAALGFCLGARATMALAILVPLGLAVVVISVLVALPLFGPLRQDVLVINGSLLTVCGLCLISIALAVVMAIRASRRSHF